MTDFKLWAPRPGRVDLVLGGERIPMTRRERDWWHVSAPAEPETDYAFSIDGGDPLPDPRSQFQPNGVHGPSRLVDHTSFGWTDGGWRGVAPPGDIVYELHVGTFTPEGTFDAAIRKLDHLAALGVGAVELMPVAEFPGDRGWGYDGICRYAPHHSYGGPDDLKRLVDACHSHGLAAILDVVCSHFGPDGGYLARYGPYFSEDYKTPWGDALNLDGPESDEVRSFFIDNALHWFANYHFDGLRLDAVHALVDTSAHHILEEVAVAVESLKEELGRTLFLIAESDLNDPRIVTPREFGGYGLNAQWNDDFHHALHAVLTGERDGYYRDFGAISDIAKSLREVFVYDGRYSEVRRRRHGRSARGLPGHRFLGYLQNHDQIGNRPRGERSSHLMSRRLLKVGAALVMTAPFVPMVFQGEEWGASSPFCYFTDHADSELAGAVARGRGLEDADGPDSQDPGTFARSMLDWGEIDERIHRDLLEWHRALIGLRREIPELRDGRVDLVTTRHDDKEGWLVLERAPMTIACNFSSSMVTVDVIPGEIVLTSAEPAGTTLPPESVTIWRA
jgi:maltooligosyltrehalose trehalohydrolase